MTNSPGRLDVRPKDLAVFFIFAALILTPFLWQWSTTFRTPPLDTGAELRAQQREDFRQANPGPPFRSFRSAAIPQAVTVFSSGPQDTIRTDIGGIICSIVDVDVQQGYLVWIPERTGLSSYQLANVRFCSHLVLMGNPKIELLEKKLSQLPEQSPIVDLLRPLAEPQGDGPYQFSDLSLSQIEQEWTLTGHVTSSAEQQPRFCWFHYELHQGEQVTKGEIEVEGLLTGQPAPFLTRLPSTRRSRVWEPHACQIKIVLRVTGDKPFGKESRN